MQERLQQIADQLVKRIKKHDVAAKTVTLKIKYSDFTLQTRSKTLPYYISDKGLILETAIELLYQEKMKDSVRLLGISLSNLNNEIKRAVAVQLKFDF
jgi:DNA polymerase-4